MLRRLLVSLVIPALLGAAPAQASPEFEAFIQSSLWPIAKGQGISRELFDRAFAGITDPDPTVLKLADNQPEITSTTSAYLEKAVTAPRIDTGKQKLVDDGKLLDAIENKYGVDRRILLGIWGIESNFGKDKGSMKVMRSLATLMYSGPRKAYGREQFIAALKILQRGVVSPENFVGSWAAALGHTQFIPTSYLAFAVDWTGDGVKDIWNSREDALASTANYLAKAGWRQGEPWGWEVTLSKDFNRGLIGRAKWRSAADWAKLGVTPVKGGEFSVPDAQAFVMIPQGIDGPKFLVTHNFMAIMDYNLSHSYALAVGHLGDRIKGGGPIVAAWPDVSYDLTFAQRVELQRRLTAMGYETGGSDGRFGARTYEAVLAFQKKAGLPLDGNPSAKLLERVRKGT
ncbi:MAG: lytic murein transglycosylase [Rhizobiales bacterium]|nr:lytic murein transglycosylase [Hyphomicrobiales bacterium]